jgi:3-deoxy-D-manno-octulosonic-acid transferase
MIFVYNLIINIFLIIFSPFLIILIIFSKKWRAELKQRFGIIDKNLLENAKGKKFIWFHSASVGEVQALIPVIKELKKLIPQKEIIVTTTSMNGKKKVEKELGNMVFFVSLLPLDTSYLINNFLNKFNIELISIIETEIWPNLIYCGFKRQIPIIVINGRISVKSFKFYYLARFFFSNILNKINLFIVQSEKMRKRYALLGVDPKKIMILSNVKYSQEFNDIKVFKDIDKKNKKIIIAGSIREGEEDLILLAFNKIKEENTILIIAPRHLNRVNYILKKLKKSKIKWQLYSSLKSPGEIIYYDIVIIDTMGELKKIYSIGDIAIIGGGFKKYGGHNPLEAAVFGLPIITGEFMFNFEDTVDMLVKNGGTFKVKNSVEEVALKLKFLMDNDDIRKQAGEKNKLFIDKMQGTAESTAIIINEILINLKEADKNV